MTFYVEKEVEDQFDFSLEQVIKKVCEKVLALENCPYEAEVNVLLTNEDGIRAYNLEYRQVDAPTDVLSFPNVDYETAADFSLIEQNWASYCNPDTDELYLGDIILCNEKIVSQAIEYGHSNLREFAFLIAHSMLHLLGYDHMTAFEEKVMIEKQEKILGELGILR